MSITQSRRDFLKSAGKLAFGACVASVVPMSAVAEETAVAHPYPYVELDPAAAEKVEQALQSERSLRPPTGRRPATSKSSSSCGAEKEGMGIPSF